MNTVILPRKGLTNAYLHADAQHMEVDARIDVHAGHLRFRPRVKRVRENLTILPDHEVGTEVRLMNSASTAHQELYESLESRLIRRWRNLG